MTTVPTGGDAFVRIGRLIRRWMGLPDDR